MFFYRILYATSIAHDHYTDISSLLNIHIYTHLALDTTSTAAAAAAMKLKPFHISYSEICGHLAFLFSAAAFLETEILHLRFYAVGSILFSMLFQYVIVLLVRDLIDHVDRV